MCGMPGMTLCSYRATDCDIPGQGPRAECAVNGHKLKSKERTERKACTAEVGGSILAGLARHCCGRSPSSTPHSLVPVCLLAIALRLVDQLHLLLLLLCT
jgi:hypothetical protein